jgi:hypothetical protein
LRVVLVQCIRLCRSTQLQWYNMFGVGVRQGPADS